MATSCLADNVWEMNPSTMRKRRRQQQPRFVMAFSDVFRGRIKDLLSGSAKKTGLNLNPICPPLMLGKSGSLHSLLSVFVFKLNSVFFLHFDIVLISNIKVHITSRKYFQSKYFQKMMDFFLRVDALPVKIFKSNSWFIHGRHLSPISEIFLKRWEKKKKHFIPSEWKWKARVKSVIGRRTAVHRDNLEVRWCTV